MALIGGFAYSQDKNKNVSNATLALVKHSNIASMNKEKSVYKKQSSLFCRTYNPWFPKHDAVYGLYIVFEIL
jgi:hypothetical protein